MADKKSWIQDGGWWTSEVNFREEIRKKKGVNHYCQHPKWKRRRKIGAVALPPDWCQGARPALPEGGQVCWGCGYEWLMAEGAEPLKRCPRANCNLKLDHAPEVEWQDPLGEDDAQGS